MRLLPARVVSAYAAPTLFAIFFYHVFTARQRSSTLKTPNVAAALLAAPSPLFSIFNFILAVVYDLNIDIEGNLFFLLCFRDTRTEEGARGGCEVPSR